VTAARAGDHAAFSLDALLEDWVISEPGDHARGGEVDRLLGRAALPVDRGGGHRFRPAGREHREASDVGQRALKEAAGTYTERAVAAVEALPSVRNDGM
jgi:hypothetical protein